jgi:acyl carrier protein
MNAVVKSRYDEILMKVIDVIRQAIGEDWIREYEIDVDTRFNDDLELESIEFVTVANGLEKQFGGDVRFIDWISRKSFDELITLTVGDVAQFVFQNMGSE